MMDLMKKTVLAGLAVIVLGIDANSADKTKQRKQAKVSERKIVDKDLLQKELEDTISELEKKLGIKYSTVPKIRASEDCEDKELLENTGTTRGFYHLRTNTIYIDSYSSIINQLINDVISGKIKGNGSLKTVSFSKKELEEIAIRGKKKTIGHECGHHYVAETFAKKLESLSSDEKEAVRINYLFNLGGRTGKIISEGIAEYFAGSLISQEDKFDDKDYPSDIRELDEDKDLSVDLKVFYQGGYHFVKPIIGKYGSKGIQQLVEVLTQTNLPITREGIVSFRAQIMKDCEYSKTKENK